MYIVAIAWLYVTLMMAITEANVIGGVLTFAFYGVLPCALFLWLFGTPQRNRNKSAKIAEQHAGEPDRPDTKAD